MSHYVGVGFGVVGYVGGRVGVGWLGFGGFKAASFSIEAPESEPTDTDTTTYIADNPEPNPDVVGQGATPVEETAEDIIAAINTPVRIVVGDGTETLPVSSLPVLSPSTATPAQLLDAIKPKKPSCAGSGLAYDKCDISLPTYDASLPLITPNPGDEVTWGRLVE